MSWLVPEAERELRHSWSASDRFIPRVFVRPAQEFMQGQAAGATVMLVTAVAALIWANLPWADGYESLWTTRVEFSIGAFHSLSGLTLREWVNDGAMTLFFLLVALAIKRELVAGELRDPRAAALPVVAALGGMIAPATIYLILNFGTAGERGWGVPMATDIAFAVAVVALVDSRIPSGAKVFLLTLAIADDLGAIVVIAVFYAQGVALGWLALAVVTVAAAYVLNRVEVRSLVPFLLLGVACWVFLHESGVHTTLAGVAFGLITPAWSFHNPARFRHHVRPMVDVIDEAYIDGRLLVGEYERVQDGLRDVSRLARESISPVNRLTDRINLWVSFGVVPVFALANAGIPITGEVLTGWATDRVLLGVALGLVVGKTFGIFTTVWLMCRLTLVRLPRGVTWRHVLGVSICAGIGFTVAMFIADLSSSDPDVIHSAKMGILAGSLVAGLLGYLVLRTGRPTATDPEAVEAGSGDRRLAHPEAA